MTVPNTGAAGSAVSDTGGNGGGRNGPSDEGLGVAQKLLRKFRGQAGPAIAQLVDENKELRVERRELKTKLATFDGPDVVVLKGDDLKTYNELKAVVGTKKPADLTKELEELGTLRGKVSEAELRTAAKDAAAHLGWNGDAFAAMVVDKKLEVSLVDAKDKDGKAIKVPHVKPAGDAKATAVAANDWVTNNASYLMPALAAKPAGAATTQTPKAGVQFVEQSGTTNGAGNNGAASQAGKASPIPGRRAYVFPSQRNAPAAGGDKK